MADNCGLETVFSILEDDKNESPLWPKFEEKRVEICHTNLNLDLDDDEILPGSAIWDPTVLQLESNFTAVIKELISRIYKNCKNEEICDKDLNSIYSKSESTFYRLLDKLSLMHKLLLEEEGPVTWRNQLHLPSLNPQNSSSVMIAAGTLDIDEGVIDRAKAIQNA